MKNKGQIRLGKAYYEHGYINFGVAYTELIANDGAAVIVDLENGVSIKKNINRTANSNLTPRIILGDDYKKWVQKKYKKGDNMNFEILKPNHIRLF